MQATTWPPRRTVQPAPDQRGGRQRRLLAGVAGGAIVLLGVGWWSTHGGGSAGQPLQRTAAARPSVPAARHTMGAPTAATSLAEASPAAVDRLWTTGSLRGTQLDGDWGRWAGQAVQPSLSLRRRFDQLLSAQDEAGLPALRAWVSQQVRAVHGDDGAAQVLAVWDRYLQLQQTAFDQRLDVADPSTWQPALAEHSRVRRQLLGSAWAEAFYGEEERSFAAMAGARVARTTPSTPSPTAADDDRMLRPAGTDLPADRLQAARVSAFGAEAADRLQAGDAAWADWQRRIAAAKSAWAALATAPELSDVQRAAAQERLLLERFAPEERDRARGLVSPAMPG